MSPLRALACLSIAGVTLAGCTGGTPAASPGESSGTTVATSPSTSTSPSEPSTSATPVPAAPRRAACYRLTPRLLTKPTNASSSVPCTARHTARTIFVGTLDTVAAGHAVAVDSATVQRQLATTCPRKLASYVGGSATTRDLSRFNVVWYSPTLEQSDQGADWFRCDLVAFAGEKDLLPLPRKGGLKGVLGRAGALGTYGLCGTAEPGSRGFRRVACARSHSWRAFDTIGLSGGKRYPGVARVRKAGDVDCKQRARSRAANTLKFRYGWEWPTRVQWVRGQHFGYCWVPA